MKIGKCKQPYTCEKYWNIPTPSTLQVGSTHSCDTLISATGLEIRKIGLILKKINARFMLHSIKQGYKPIINAYKSVLPMHKQSSEDAWVIN